MQRVLAGMAERRVAEIVDERHAFRQILVQLQRARQRAGDLRHLDRVGQPGAVMVAVGAMKTWVLCFSRRKAVVWTMRSRSRWNRERVGLSVSLNSRPRLCAGIAGIGRAGPVTEADVARTRHYPEPLRKPPVDLPPCASYLLREINCKVTRLGADVKTGMKVELTDAAAKRIAAIVAKEPANRQISFLYCSVFGLADLPGSFATIAAMRWAAASVISTFIPVLTSAPIGSPCN